MRYDSSMKCMTNNRNGVVALANRYFTNIGLIKNKSIIVLETPVLFYSNNPAGGEVSANKVGAFTYFNYNPEIRNVASIGRFCSIGQNVIAGIAGHSTTALSHHQIFERRQVWAEPFWEYDSEWVEQNKSSNFKREPKRKGETVIGNDVWIGANAIIMNGVNIGNGAIIAAGSIITKDVPPYTIVGGVTKTIRKRFSDELTDRLLESKWWEYGPNVLKGLDIANPYECIDELEKRISEGFPKYVSDKFEFDTKKQTVTKVDSISGKRELIYKM